MAVGPWMAVAGALAPKVIGALDNGPERAAARSRKRRSENFAEGQAIQDAQRGFGQRQNIVNRLGGDPIFMQGASNDIYGRGQALEKKQLDQQLADEKAAEDQQNGWQSWLGPLMGAGIATAGAIGSEMAEDPYKWKNEQLNQTADEADFIRSQGLQGPQLATALEENDERTRSALFGSRNRMTRHDF